MPAKPSSMYGRNYLKPLRHKITAGLSVLF